MTKKHFIAISEVIRNQPLTSADRSALVNGLISKFHLENERFDAQRFAAACGVGNV